MSKALYRKYRSKSLDEIVGQKHITDILSRAISQGNISHAYLLTGPRGVGKTSVARIMAYEINGLPYDEASLNLDIIEIDAASNNGVEDVRDLREKVQIAPVSAKKKVYIIDEVHMLSKAAFNALLKTLEEPPEHIVFILATTNAEKLPSTIISRTQRFSFRPIGLDDAIKHLKYIAKQEKINIDDDALEIIAKRGDGSFRDSISLLDQISSLIDNDQKTTITASLVENILGLAPNEIIENLLKAIDDNSLEKLVTQLNKAYADGIDGSTIASQMISKIYSEISVKPQLLPLLDSLIDVEKSSQPQLKLLSVLGLYLKPENTDDRPKAQQRSVALEAAPLEVKASVNKLQKMKDEIIEEKTVTKKSKPTNSQLKKHIKTANFDWAQFIDYIKQNYVAIHSVLSKCNYQLDGDDLILYTNSNFYKKKLDDVKYAPLLSKSLRELGFGDLNIHTIPTTIPLRDEKMAAVAAIMGGGEEVSLEAA